MKCYLHEQKAYRIVVKFIHDDRVIVEAIKSYANICLQYPELNPQKRKLINLVDIEKRMARLLQIVKG
mgnify:CR=1 FL=1